MRLGNRSARRWAVLGVLVGIIGVGGAIVAASGRGAWPVGVVISPPPGSRGNGFAADGRSYWTANADGPAKWDTATGLALPTLTQPVVFRRSVAGDGATFVGLTGLDFTRSEVVLGDEAAGAIRARWPVSGRQILHPTLEDGGQTVRAFLDDWTALLEIATWDVATGTETRRAIRGPLGRGIPRNMPPNCSPDGRVWVYADPGGAGWRLWDAVADQPVGDVLRPHDRGLLMTPMVAFTPDGKTLILGLADGQAEVWDVASSRRLRVLRVHRAGCTFEQMAVAPDGRTLVSYGKDPRLWSSLLLVRAAFAYLSFGSARGVTYETVVTDLATGAILARSPGSIRPEFSPDGRTIATEEPDGTFALRAAPQPTDR